jgi:Flp pilus assembly protein TadG
MKLGYGLCHLVANACRGELGSILILSALVSIVVIGSAGLAVDVSRMYAARAEISRAVDAAALAGVLEFNGGASGLTAAQTKAQAYMTANEPTANATITPDGATNKMTIKASKTVKLYFLSLFGFNAASVYGHAVAGFQDQTIDAVMVIDSTYSMSGTPITNAKTAATNFKNTLLGTSPSGNVYVAVTPLRGCYRPTPISYSDCVYNTVQSGTVYVQDLTSNSSALDTAITAVAPGGLSATNVCTGLGKGYEVINSTSPYSTNHQSNPKNRRYMVLLSDGDNVYFGDNVYQASPASPNTFSVGGTNYACQPPNTCTGWGSPCFTGTISSSGGALATDTFETNNFTGGTGWAASWTNSGAATSSTSAQGGTYKAVVNSTDTLSRQVNLSNASNATFDYYIRSAGSWTTSDRFYVETSPDNSTWTTGATYCVGCSVSGVTAINSTYAQFNVSLSSLAGDSSAYVRFRANITSGTSQQVYVDTVNVFTTNGYLNTQDGQDYTSCTETPVPRERQIDVETLNIANAIKAQGVEIFVVAFSVCADSDGTTVYGSSACASQANPVSSAPSSGAVGDTTTETTANTRLAKCIASSTTGTNDHFWYATSASDLPNIFTTIAAQIAHRLVE